MNSEKVIEVFDSFVDTLTKPTVVVLEELPLEGIMLLFIKARSLNQILLDGLTKA